jgi:hypothetical protein
MDECKKARRRIQSLRSGSAIRWINLIGAAKVIASIGPSLFALDCLPELVYRTTLYRSTVKEQVKFPSLAVLVFHVEIGRTVLQHDRCLQNLGRKECQSPVLHNLTDSLSILVDALLLERQ